ncbi:hypothetical protein [uncultured Pseudokineococcus sp.]|uniref:hypothetical protein n=1 Tax=uncultured Pseudokineococcus sp. TaxID=1642928 RepID=UPI00260E163D|nr:hypothetical protein [uncultured Pseudokineococcus sp.]
MPLPSPELPSSPERRAAPRGAARRAALVSSAADLVAAGGPAAVSARAAARAAQVPLAAVSYHFDDVASLVREAVAELLDRLAADVAVRSAGPLPPVGQDEDGGVVAAAVVAAVLGPYGAAGAAGVRALYARTLELAGDEALAPRLRAFDEVVTAAVARLLAAAGRRPERAREVLALADGWLVAAAVAGAGSGADPEGALRGWAAERLAPGLVLLAPPPA